MAIKVGVREFVKDFNKLQNIDMVEIIDKKTKTLKGIYLSANEALKVKNLLEKERKKRFEKFMKYVGSMEVDEKFKDLEGKKLKEAIAKVKAGL